MIVKVEGVSGQDLAKRFFWLAYQASSVFGMGAMQATEDATEEAVWNRIVNNGDRLFYSGPPQSGRIHADYCFGRMMKFGLYCNADSIDVNELAVLSFDYQAWCRKYKTVESLISAVTASFPATNTVGV
jgi:hypothetical protein